MSQRTKTIILIAEVVLFSAAALGVWYYKSLDNFSLMRDEQGVVQDSEKFLYGPASSDTIKTGEALARAHCGGCHLLPAPSVLPAAGWRPVLENMGVRLGLAHRVKYLNEKHLGLIEGLKSLQQYPAAPALSPQEFRLLKKYYYANANDIETPGRRDWPAARVFQPGKILRLARADLTLVKIAPDGKSIYAGGMVHNRPGDPDGFLARYDVQLKEQARLDFKAPPVALTFAPPYTNGLLTTLGDPAGGRRFPASVYRMGTQKKAGRSMLTVAKIAAKNFRMTRAEPVLLEPNDKPLLLLTGFGFLNGGLFLTPPGKDTNPGAEPGPGDRTYTVPGEVKLESGPGPIDTRVFDADGDGRVDIVALVAQAREGLLLYHNRAQSTNKNAIPIQTSALERITLDQRHPGFGATGLEIADFDGDGKTDILVVNGDNADFPDAPVKADHGLRIYRNESMPGKPAFREMYFFPMAGATRALARDFDGDGDQDIAAAALYAVHPEERYVFLENKGANKFAAFRLPLPGGDESPVCGVLDAGDIDGDGDDDLVLGALPYFSDPAGVGKAAAGKERPVLFVLDNTTNKNKNPKTTIQTENTTETKTEHNTEHNSENTKNTE